jgi:hypothetical protein
MVRVILQSTYVTQYGTRGYQGSESDYDSAKSVDDYVNEFTKFILHCNPGSWGVDVHSVAKTVHNADGTFVRDEDGHRIEERLFFKNIW